MPDITKQMIGSDRPVIYRLHASHNPHRWEIVGSTGRIDGLVKMPLPEKLPCPDCPEGVNRFSVRPIEDWANCLDDLVVEFKPRVPHELPDRFSFKSVYMIVSGRCRDAFERIDPDGGHIFLPLDVKNTEEEPVGGPWYYMWCGRTFGATEVEHSAGIVQDGHTKGPHFKRMLATPDRCEFFRDVPVWTHAGGDGPTYLSHSVFDALHNEGLTGFREYTTRHGFDLKSDDDTWADVITPQNVSHIWL